MLTGAVAALIVCTMTACGTVGDGVRVEGAPTDAAPSRPDSSAAPSSWPSGDPGSARKPRTGPKPDPTAVNDDTAPFVENGEDREVSETEVVSVIRRDPKVSAHVKRGLKPCQGELYPVGIGYARATHGQQADLVVNVTSCTDSVGVGAYVYRRSSSGALVNVFSAERPPVWAEFRNGMLEVTRDVYVGDEPLCCPSGRDIVTYGWQDGVFHEVARARRGGERDDSGGADGDGSVDGRGEVRPPSARAPAQRQERE